MVQLFTFVAYGNALTMLGLTYLLCLGGAFVMFYVVYPKHDEWHRYHTVMHAVCSGGSVVFDAAVRTAMIM